MAQPACPPTSTPAIPAPLRDVPDAMVESMNAMGRLGGPAQIAAVAAFLLFPDASHLIGATVDARGRM